MDAFLNPIALLVCYYTLAIASSFILDRKVSASIRPISWYFQLTKTGWESFSLLLTTNFAKLTEFESSHSIFFDIKSQLHLLQKNETKLIFSLTTRLSFGSRLIKKNRWTCVQHYEDRPGGSAFGQFENGAQHITRQVSSRIQTGTIIRKRLAKESWHGAADKVRVMFSFVRFPFPFDKIRFFPIIFARNSNQPETFCCLFLSLSSTILFLVVCLYCLLLCEHNKFLHSSLCLILLNMFLSISLLAVCIFVFRLFQFHSIFSFHASSEFK